MSFDEQPVAYCTNVHPAATVGDMMTQLQRYASPLAERLGKPFSVGLWLPRSALKEMNPIRAGEFGKWLDHNGLMCVTMNAFPFGDFHADRVKYDVYEPDWTTSERADYTCRVADFLASILPPETEGSISTLPMGWGRKFSGAPASTFFPMLIETARHLAYLKESTGKLIRLAIEPEPGCVLERYSFVPRFFSKLKTFASDSSLLDDYNAVQEHIGVCFDVCHAAVMYEDAAEMIALLQENDVRIVKVQLSSAIDAVSPSDENVLRALAPFVEDRYLHQTAAMHPSGTFLFMDDLAGMPLGTPPELWRECPSWRIHYHVPIHANQLGPLHTTSSTIASTLKAVKKLPYSPHIEVETYTWNVLPNSARTGADDLVQGLEAELRHATALKRQVMNSATK